MEEEVMLSDGDKSELLEIARQTLQSYFAGNTIPENQPASESFKERRGAFVSLHNGDELRGCIGQLFPDSGISEVVRHCVISAASEDMRFPPVTKEEVPDLAIEISVLTPFCRIKQIEEIEV